MHSTLTSPFFWKEVLQLHTSHKCLKCRTFMASPPQPAMDVLTLSEKNLKQTGLPGKWSCSSARSQHFVFVILRWAEEKSMVSKEGVNYYPHPWDNCSKEVREEPGYKFFNKRQVVWASKDYCYLKEARCPQLRNVVLFYIWEDARVWDNWNHSFGMHISYLKLVFCVLISCNSFPEGSWKGGATVCGF